MAPLLTGCVASEQTEEGASSGLADARTDGAGSDTLGEMYSSGTRIKMRLARTEGGAKSLMGWHDVQFETDCGFQEDVDGALRCFPVGTAIELNEVYADANCTVRAAMVNECSFSQGEHPEWAVVERSPSACGLRGLPLGYRRVTGYSEGPTYGREGSSCVVVAGNPNLRLSDTLVPYTEFAIATESVE